MAPWDQYRFIVFIVFRTRCMFDYDRLKSRLEVIDVVLLINAYLRCNLSDQESSSKLQYIAVCFQGVMGIRILICLYDVFHNPIITSEIGSIKCQKKIS